MPFFSSPLWQHGLAVLVAFQEELASCILKMAAKGDLKKLNCWQDKLKALKEKDSVKVVSDLGEMAARLSSPKELLFTETLVRQTKNLVQHDLEQIPELQEQLKSLKKSVESLGIEKSIHLKNHEDTRQQRVEEIKTLQARIKNAQESYMAFALAPLEAFVPYVGASGAARLFNKVYQGDQTISVNDIIGLIPGSRVVMNQQDRCLKSRAAASKTYPNHTPHPVVFGDTRIEKTGIMASIGLRRRKINPLL